MWLAALFAGCRPDPTPTPTVPTSTAETGDPCASACDDGRTCTQDTCDAEGRCISIPIRDCVWPASLPPEPGVVGLAGLDPGFSRSLSGAVWDGTNRALWVLRGDGAVTWRLVPDPSVPEGFRIDHTSSLGTVDVESLVIPDPVGAPTTLYVMVELAEQIRVYDASGPTAVLVRTFATSPWLPAEGTSGSEGLAFVPDEALSAWGFVDPSGSPRTSQLGLGGLFFVGHQNGGQIYVFDLPAGDEPIGYVGAYDTARAETSGLEFDHDTGRLYVWHGSDYCDLEVVRLSSTDAGGPNRKLDTESIWDYPDDPNIEGIALLGLSDCVDGARPLVLTTDDGFDRALDVYTDWPFCRP